MPYERSGPRQGGGATERGREERLGAGVGVRAGRRPRSCDADGRASVTGAAGRHELAGAGRRWVSRPGASPAHPGSSRRGRSRGEPVRGTGGRVGWVGGRGPDLGGRGVGPRSRGAGGPSRTPAAARAVLAVLAVPADPADPASAAPVRTVPALELYFWAVFSSLAKVRTACAVARPFALFP